MMHDDLIDDAAMANYHAAMIDAGYRRCDECGNYDYEEAFTILSDGEGYTYRVCDERCVRTVPHCPHLHFLVKPLDISSGTYECLVDGCKEIPFVFPHKQ